VWCLNSLWLLKICTVWHFLIFVRRVLLMTWKELTFLFFSSSSIWIMDVVHIFLFNHHPPTESTVCFVDIFLGLFRFFIIYDLLSEAITIKHFSVCRKFYFYFFKLVFLFLFFRESRTTLIKETTFFVYKPTTEKKDEKNKYKKIITFRILTLILKY